MGIEYLLSQWWGILLLTIVSLAVLVLISALLYKPLFKRVYDVVLSALAIIVLSPILIVLTILGAIKMKGNPFFTQLRPGRICKRTGKEKIFKLIKFRTMTCEKDADGNFLPDEVRLTKYGRMLRSTSLDELPELFNIFLGHMSIVGPRPQLVRDMVFMSENERKRHSVRPGLTGLAQVNGRNNITWEEKFDWDIKYIQKISLWKDIAIILKTVLKVLKRSDVEREGTVSDIDLGDYLLQENKITKEEYAEKQIQAKELIKGK
ncbi:MAG: sugar transferase [Clostridiales bacterium]|nr:sugar transferase [Clostridiales bacterium]